MHLIQLIFQRTVSTLQVIYELLADDQLPGLSSQLSFEDLNEAIVGKIRENLHNAGELARMVSNKSFWMKYCLI